MLKVYMKFIINFYLISNLDIPLMIVISCAICNISLLRSGLLTHGIEFDAIKNINNIYYRDNVIFIYYKYLLYK